MKKGRNAGMTDAGVRFSRSRGKLWLWYSVAFIIVAAVIFLPFVFYNKTLIWKTDGYLQWYPILSKLKHTVEDLFQGNGFSFWSWDTGMGSDLIGNYALVLCDPFSYLAVLFPYKDLDIAYSVIIVVKMYFAGFAMFGYLRYRGRRVWVSLICSLSYAFSAWTLIALRHEFFLTPLVLFPLIIWGIDRVDDQKSPTLLILSVMMSIVTSLYFSYMTALMAVLYIVVKYFVESRAKTARDFIFRLAKYVLYAFIGGVLLPAPIMLPALYSLSQASTGTGVDIRILPNLEQLLRFIPSFAGDYDVNYNYSVLGVNMLLVSMIPAMILLWKKKRTSIHMLLICIVCVLFPFGQSVLNGFSYSSGRWCYMYCFFFISAAAEALESGILQTLPYKKGVKIMFGILFCASLIASVIFKAISMRELFVITVNLLLGLLLINILFHRSKKVRRWLMPVALLNIMLVPVLSNSPNVGGNMDIYMTQGVCYDIYESAAVKAAQTIEDNDFYRVDTVDHLDNKGVALRETHTPENSNIYWQTPSVCGYLSTMDKELIRFNQFLTNSAGDFRRMCIYSNDNRSRMDFLLGVKYFVCDDMTEEMPQSGYAGYGTKTKGTVGGVDVLQYPYTPGLGYVFSQAMSESDFLQYSALEREQLLMQCVEMDDEDLKQVSTSIIRSAEGKTEASNVASTITDAEENVIAGKSITITKENSRLTIQPNQKIARSEVFLVLKNFRKEPVTPEAMWNFRVASAMKENNVGEMTNNDSYSKKKFLSNYLSYTPYEDFSIRVSLPEKNITKRIVNAAGEPQGIRDNTDYMINLGYYGSFDEKINCIFENIGNYTFDSIELVAVPIQSYKQQAKLLSGNRLKIKENHGDVLRGTVTSATGGMLYLSIPYHPGWKIYIDNKQVENVYRVNTAFTGVEVSEGTHKVKLVYRPVGYPYTLPAFGMGAVITIVMALYFRNKFSRKKKENQEEKTA